jgi:DNA-3-methyladenine glycosylase I
MRRWLAGTGPEGSDEARNDDMNRAPRRCAWLNDDPLYIEYHDTEWGVPQHDPLVLFECLLLEGAQAGLSWYTILKKREGYRNAFAGYDPVRLARFDTRRIDRLVLDPAIVRHRGKIEAFVGNARAYLAMRDAGEDFASLLWSFVGGQPRRNRWRDTSQVPASTPESAQVSRELKRRGFRFVGPTTCYAFMQAVGMVNDHTVSCFRHRELHAG